MQSTPPDMYQFSPGTLIAGRYEVCEKLGYGGMGLVLKVFDTALDREPIALKLLYPHHVQDNTVFARFRNEVLVARKLAHPNIVKLFDFGNAGGGFYYISMELIEGTSLTRRLYGPKHARPNFKEILKILYEIALGLGAAHKMGVVHRDLKPDNVLLSRSAEVKLTDFGLARSLLVDKGFTQSGEAVGTPYYMSPEQIQGNVVDIRSDIYALGIMAYELVVGQRPFENEVWINLAALHFTEPIPKFATKESGIPAWYEEFVETCAAKRPEDRYQTMEEVAEILLPALGEDYSNTKRMSAVFGLYASDAKIKRKKFVKPYQKKLKRTASILVPFLVFLLLVNLVTPVNRFVTAGVLRLEQILHIPLTPFKKFLGTDLTFDQTEFIKHTLAGDIQTVGTLLMLGMDPNISNQAGRTALELSIARGSPAMVKLLLDYGAEVNRAGERGLTPLMQAVNTRDPNVIEVILQKEPLINARDKEGITALHYAVLMKDPTLVQMLVDRGAGTGVLDRSGKTAFMYAVEGGMIEIAWILLRGGIDANKADLQGKTVLMYAVEQGDLELTRALLEQGADVLARNREGKAVLDYVSGGDRKAIKELLISKASMSSSSSPSRTYQSNNSKPEKIISSPTGDQRISSLTKLTRLRILGKPEIRWERPPRELITLRWIKVLLKNVGDIEAQNVTVMAKLSSGKTYQLSGPGSISGGQTADYLVEPQLKATEYAEVEVVVDCANCRK